MKGEMKMEKQLYLVSDDLGNTWSEAWLTDKEVEYACMNFYMVKAK